MAKQYHFVYDSTNNWDNLNAAFLSQYQVVLFWIQDQSSQHKGKHFSNTCNMAAPGWDFILRALH